ncbi:MAG: hypothetical protein ACP5HD_07025 [Thermoproteus sp.]
MEIAELLGLVATKGVDYVLSQLPTLLSKREISREDALLILAYLTIGELRGLREEVRSLGAKIDEMHKDLSDKLDFISNQLRVLNSNISATYELTSRVMAKLMELGVGARV